jgi:hypothetical protein
LGLRNARKISAVNLKWVGRSNAKKEGSINTGEGSKESSSSRKA